MTDATATEQTAPEQASDFEALAVLAGLSGVTAEHMALLRIITDPAMHADRQVSTHTEIADLFADEFSGYDGGDPGYEAQQVGELLYLHYSGLDDLPDFGYGFDATSGGEVEGFTITASITAKTAEGSTDWANRITLSSTHEFRDITIDRSATGWKAALGYAVALDAEFLDLCARARRRGLLPAARPVVDRAVAALAAYDTAVARDDVDVDVVADMRENLIGLLAAQGIQPTT